MKPRVVALLSALLLSTGLSAVAPPAGATDVCAGQGTFTSTPLFYPVTAGTGVTVQQPPWGTWAFNIGTGTCAPSTGKGLAAAGLMNGWCGLASGSGTTSNGYRFVWQNVGSVLVFTGGLVGIGTMQPDVLNGQSCMTGATSFIIAVGVVKVGCNLLKQKFLTTSPVPIPPTLTPLPGGLGSVHSNSTHTWSKLCVGVK